MKDEDYNKLVLDSTREVFVLIQEKIKHLKPEGRYLIQARIVTNVFRQCLGMSLVAAEEKICAAEKEGTG